MKDSGKWNIPKEKFLNDIEKIEPDELSEDMASVYSEITKDLEKEALAMQKEISPIDIFETVLDIAEKYIEKNRSKN